MVEPLFFDCSRKMYHLKDEVVIYYSTKMLRVKLLFEALVHTL